TQNITRFAIHRPAKRMRIGGIEIALPPHKLDNALVFTQTSGAWRCDGSSDQITITGKRPGLQGPIDDAFTTPFLCVRGTGKAWNPAVGAWAEANLARFSYEWHRYFRGELPVKDDRDVTPDDLQRCNLILFGDPASNSLIAKAMEKLPITWTEKELRLGGQHYPSTTHAPVLIHPN